MAAFVACADEDIDLGVDAAQSSPDTGIEEPDSGPSITDDDGGNSETPDGGNQPAEDAGEDGGQPGEDAGEDGGQDPGQGPKDLVSCEKNPPLTPATDGSCNFEQGTGTAVLIQANVVGPDKLYENGYVLYDTVTGLVLCTGCECATHEAAKDASHLGCQQATVTPGLINAHEHLSYGEASPAQHGDVRYQHRHDWRTGKHGADRLQTPRGEQDGIAYAELRHLMAGATSINGSGSVTGLLRNLDSKNQEGLDLGEVEYSTFPLGDSNGTTHESGCSYRTRPRPSSLERYSAYAPHIAEGIDLAARNEFVCLSEGENNVITDKTAIIHGVGLTAADYRMMGGVGASLIWSPRTNIDLYGFTAPVLVAKNAGVQIALGTDWPSSGSMNMLREMKCAVDYSKNNLGSALSERDVLDMATKNAAAVLKADKKIGRLAPGFVADIAIFEGKTRPYYRAVIDGSPKDVALVLRGGKPLYGDASLLTALSAPTTCETLDVCGQSKRVCLESETGDNLATLKTKVNEGSIALFYCDTPPNEPSCVPFRPQEFMGIPQEGDQDGDGIPDAQDLCPTVFSAPMMLDNSSQADTDQDGVGDACDVCPFDANTESCTPPDPNDRDGDGIPNAEDNCPSVANPDQADADSDGKGDACDPCPQESNPGSAACSASIYSIKNETLTSGRWRLSNLLVTAVGRSVFFAQKVAGDADYTDENYSGIMVYMGRDAKPALGDRVTVDGDITKFYGQVQLQHASFEVVSQGNTLPNPVVVTPSEIADLGARRAALEGVLVRVEDVRVSDINPTPGAGDRAPTHEFELEGGLRVNDYLYQATMPAVGDRFNFIQGPLRWGNNHSKIEPRSADDLEVQAAPVTLTGFSVTGPISLTVGHNGAVSGLSVVLSGNATSDTPVQLSSSDAAVVAPAAVTVPAGQDRASVSLEAVSAAQNVTLTASYGGQSATVTINVVEAGTLAISRVRLAKSSLSTGETTQLTVTLTSTPTEAVTVTLSVNPAGSATVPSTATVPPGSAHVTVNFEAGSTAGSGTVSASLDSGSPVSANFTVTAASSTTVQPWINEFHYDNSGRTDLNEGVEVAGPAGLDLTGWKLLLINGSGGAVYGTINLNGILSDAGAGYGFQWNDVSPIQNGGPNGDGLMLVNPDDEVVEFLSYEANNQPITETYNGMSYTSTSIGISENGSTPADHSLQRTGSGNKGSDFTWTAGASTHDAVNIGQSFTTP